MSECRSLLSLPLNMLGLGCCVVHSHARSLDLKFQDKKTIDILKLHDWIEKATKSRTAFAHLEISCA